MDAGFLPHDPCASDEEAQLIEAAKKGDESAFEKLFHANKMAVNSSVLFMLAQAGMASDAEDVTLVAMARAWLHIHAFRHDCTFCSWVKSIARHECLDRLKSNGRRLTREQAWIETLLAQAECTDGARVIMTREQHQRLVEMVMRLPPKERAVVEDKFLHGRSTSEVASRFHLNINQANGLIRRALERLRKWLHGIP